MKEECGEQQDDDGPPILERMDLSQPIDVVASCHDQPPVLEKEGGAPDAAEPEEAEFEDFVSAGKSKLDLL